MIARGSVGRETDDDSEDETQLPKNQPIWIEETLDNAGRESEEDGNDSPTQLPQDQPPYVVQTMEASNEDIARDFVPVSSMLLDERVSEDEDDIPVTVLLQRQKGTKTNDSQDNSGEDDDNVPVATKLTREKGKTNKTVRRSVRDKNGDIVTGEKAVGVGIAKNFQDLGLFKGVVDRVRKEGRELLYHVAYEDGDEEELSMYEYTLACQLFESIEMTNDDGEHVDVHTLVDGEHVDDSNDEGSEYSDTDDRKARKSERKRMLAKRKKRKQTITTSPKKQSKRARLKAKTVMDSSDIELLGGKDTFAAKTWNSMNPEEQGSTLVGMEKPMATTIKKKVQSELLKVVPLIVSIVVSNSCLEFHLSMASCYLYFWQKKYAALVADALVLHLQQNRCTVDSMSRPPEKVEATIVTPTIPVSVGDFVEVTFPVYFLSHSTVFILFIIATFHCAILKVEHCYEPGTKSEGGVGLVQQYDGISAHIRSLRFQCHACNNNFYNLICYEHCYLLKKGTSLMARWKTT